MTPAAPHPEEDRRLEVLSELKILDTLVEQEYDDLTYLAATICGTPIALVSLIDADRQWFKSHHGLDATETPRELAFCAHAILGEGPFVVPDSLADERFCDNPLVTGEPRVRFYAGVPLRLEGLPLGTLCVIDHQARELPGEQRRALESLGRQVESLLKLRHGIARVQEASRYKDEFLSMMDHEMRTPLTSIHGALKLLASEEVRASEQVSIPLIDTAMRNSERLLAVIGNILDAAALTTGRLVLSAEAFELSEAVTEAIELLGSEAAVDTSGLAAGLSVEADRRRIIQVIHNLLSNALQHSSGGEPVRVSSAETDGGVRVEVVNQGPAVSQEQGAGLFTRFHKRRAPGAEGKRSGAGLGLAIVRGLVEAHNGRYGVLASGEAETTFWFELPGG